MNLNAQMSVVIPLVLWSGFFTMCIVQLLKPFTRLYVHRAVLDRWLTWVNYTTKPLSETKGAASDYVLFGTIPRSIEIMPSEQYCGYIAQKLTRRYEASKQAENTTESSSSGKESNSTLRALQKVDELLARIRRGLELAIQVEVFIVAIVIFGILYRGLGVTLALMMQAIALLVAAYSATIFRDLVAIIEKLKR